MASRNPLGRSIRSSQYQPVEFNAIDHDYRGKGSHNLDTYSTAKTQAKHGKALQAATACELTFLLPRALKHTASGHRT